MFLTKDDFLKHFPLRKKINRNDFKHKLKIMYTKPMTLHQVFSLKPINIRINGKMIERKPIMKGADDFRYKNREKVVDFFYQMLVTHRHYYLGKFYDAYFRPKNPFQMKWDSAVNIRIDSKKDKNLSMQKNDASKTILRNMFYKELLHETRITNTIKNRVSFWESLVNLYNKFELEDRFFAPSSIELFLRPKTSTKMPTDLPHVVGLDKKLPGFNPRLNYHNLFYLFQAYQPKASIMNPYFVHWILDNIFNNCGGKTGKRMFTPVLSWLAYLVGFFHTDGWTEYVGNDIMKSQCQGGKFLADWYYKNTDKKVNNANADTVKRIKNKNVKFYCQPSEKLAKDKTFLNKYKNYFDLVLICPPYFDMEVYEDRASGKGDLQSTKQYKDYDKWLEGYWRPTAKLCYHTCAKNGCFALIINNYFTLTGDYYPLVEDCTRISKEIGFKVKETYYLFNRTSPLRINNKDRTERLIVFSK
jgi:hypothetical protein